MRFPRLVRSVGACWCLSLLVPCWIPAHDASAAEQPALFDFREIVRDAKRRVFPTVVFIRAVRETMHDGRTLMQEVSGSGVMISESGEVLSNWHVVERATEIRCLLHDGRAFQATLVGSDKDTDIALLQLTLSADTTPLPFAELGDSSRLTEGDFVMAMGAPWGLSRSVSIGIVSCARRYLPQRSEYTLWVQTDAAISPGNSGGPLVDTGGQVVGINALGILIGGDAGFAIPSTVIAEVLPSLRKDGAIDWSFTGLELQPLTDFNRNIYFEAEEGVVVASTDPGSPAREAGLRTGDRILTIGGNPVTARSEEDLPDIRRRIGLLPKDVPAVLTFVRDGEHLDATLTPIRKGQVEGEELDCPRWDLTVKSINRFDTPDLFFFRPEGVFVFGIRRPGNAQLAGLRPRDILLEIDGHPVGTLEAVRQRHARAMERIGETTRVVLTILRGGHRRQIVLDYSRDFQVE